MNEMVERVAKALAKSRGVVIMDEVDYRQFAADARAVIAAMREPTDAMLGAGKVARVSQSHGWIYRQMVDAALDNQET